MYELGVREMKYGITKKKKKKQNKNVVTKAKK